MAKKGLDFFPFDTVMDLKLRRVEAEFGLIGFAVIVKLLMHIYRENGYYCTWLPDDVLDFSAEIFGSQNGKKKHTLVAEIVNNALRRGIFSQKIYKKYGVLTSREIQEIYRDAVKRRKNVEWIQEYLLVKVMPFSDQSASAIQNVCISEKNVNISEKNDDIFKQKKGKEKREKNNIFSPPSYEEAETYRKNNNLKMDTQEFLDYYTARGWHTSNGTSVDAWRPLMHGWARKQSEFDSKKSVRQPRKNPAAAQSAGSSLDMDKLDRYINSQFDGPTD